ncbi:hypothetical protein L596_009373 [Steinernema carpocapsae]|uniref:Uncharacterized protein n=1 Tax=Steinernema carpocapsae TaxID=34508 RepID=A0A4U5PFG1_STECR|nr:hypothetical protein L596_009373 [Steinernema carpocapsae]
MACLDRIAGQHEPNSKHDFSLNGVDSIDSKSTLSKYVSKYLSGFSRCVATSSVRSKTCVRCTVCVSSTHRVSCTTTN